MVRKFDSPPQVAYRLQTVDKVAHVSEQLLYSLYQSLLVIEYFRYLVIRTHITVIVFIVCILIISKI